MTLRVTFVKCAPAHCGPQRDVNVRVQLSEDLHLRLPHTAADTRPYPHHHDCIDHDVLWRTGRTIQFGLKRTGDFVFAIVLAELCLITRTPLDHIDVIIDGPGVYGGTIGRLRQATRAQLDRLTEHTPSEPVDQLDQPDTLPRAVATHITV